MNVELLFDACAELGEVPAWDAHTQTLYWVDVLAKRIYTGVELLAQLDDYVGCVAPRKDGRLILTQSACIAELDPDDLSQGQPAAAKPTVRAAVSEPANNRFNDGKCDPAGRFLAGTMDKNEKDASGALYSYDGGAVTKLLTGIRISNGLTWSPDYKTFYYIDTPTRNVKAFDYDLASGQIVDPRIVVHVPESLGWPDGMTSDTDGNLWIALWDGAQVTKWSPNTGRLLEQIPIPALQSSSCVFGGRHMNELYVTSARVGLSEADLTKYPLSGGLFKVTTKVTGMPTFEFSGM